MDSYPVITFHSTHHALQFERELKQRNIAGRLIPVPRQISASCGLAGKITEEDLASVLALCKLERLSIQGVYRVFADKHRAPQDIGPETKTDS